LLCFLLICLVSGQYTPLTSVAVSDSVQYDTKYYTFYVNSFSGEQTFEIDLWRTQTYQYPASLSLWLTVNDPSGRQLWFSSFYGQQQITTTSTGNHTILLELLSGESSMSYQIRACTFGCNSDQCTYSSNFGYCSGNGACIYGVCFCDNTTSLTTLNSFDCSLNYGPLPPVFETLWIALIIIGFLLVVILPLVICVCCCGVCAAAANSERHPIIHHHHPSPINPAYSTGPVYNTMAVPTPGVSYIQAQPAAPYQPGQPMFPGQQPFYQPQQQPPFQPQQQPPFQPQAQPSLYPKNENYEKV